MTTPAIASLCPLCGGDNQCAMAQGLPPEQCWCMAATIPPEALAAIAPEQRGQQCICTACAQRYLHENSLKALSNKR
ncbi:MAG: cysteine-rich CWC family protein [Comamonas sp.]